MTRGGRQLAKGPDWKGTSGAAVFVYDSLVAVISQAEVDGSLQAVPIAHATGHSITAFAEGREPQSSIDRFRELLAHDEVSIRTTPARRLTNETERMHQIARRTPSLHDRERELQKLADFAHSSETYQWWIGTPWAGKTALAARFAIEPPDDVDVVAFFISRSEGAQTRQFQQAVCDQLSSLLDEPCPQWADQGAFISLWQRAMQQAEVTCRHLLLLVDGLDENDEFPPIAALLPVEVSTMAHVLVLSRQQPPIPDEAAPEHPLRDEVRCLRIALASSPHAKLIRQRAVADLSSQLRGDQHARIVLALLATAAPLSIDDAAAILGSLNIGRADIERVIRSAAGRALRSTFAGLHERYAFAHDILRDVTIDELGVHAIDSCTQLVHQWADHYARRKWPSNTPDYLLEVYPTVLSSSRDVDRLTALPTLARLELWRARQGHDASAVRELEMALDVLSKDANPNIAVACTLALRLQRLRDLVSHVSADVVEGWAALGHWDRATHIASNVRSVLKSQAAWLGIAMMAIAVGDIRRAEQVLEGVNEPRDRVRILVRLASYSAGESDRERARAMLDAAEDAAREITERDDYEIVLTEIAISAADVDDEDRIDRLIDEIGADYLIDDLDARRVSAMARKGDLANALALTNNISDINKRIEAITATAVAAMYDRKASFAQKAFAMAENEANAVEEESTRIDALRLIGVGHGTVGNVDRMLTLLSDTGGGRALEAKESYIAAAVAISAAGRPDVGERLIVEMEDAAAAAACAQIASKFAQIGQFTQADVLFDRAQLLVGRLRESRERLDVLIDIAVTAANSGQTNRASKLLDEAEALADSNATRLARLAVASAQAGDRRRAEALLHRSELVKDPNKFATEGREYLGSLAAAAAEVGRWSDADHLLNMLATSEEREWALTDLASAAKLQSDAGRCEGLMDRIRSPQVRAWAHAKIAVATGKTGDQRDAARQLVELNVGYVRTWALTRLAVVGAQLGDLSYVRSCTEGIKDAGQRSSALLAAAEAACSSSKDACCVELLDDVENILPYLNDLYRTAWVYAAMANVDARLRCFHDASRWLGCFDQIISTIRDPATSLRLTVKAAPAIGLIYGMEYVHELLDDELLHNAGQRGSDWLLSDIVSAMADRGGSVDVSELVSHVTDPLAKAAALAQMSQSATIRGDAVNAKRLLEEAESHVTMDLRAQRADDVIAKIFSAAMHIGNMDARKAVILGLRSSNSSPWLAKAVLVDPSSVDVIVKELGGS